MAGLDLTERVQLQQHHHTLYGIEDQGGLLREVDNLKARVGSAEERLNSLSMKWMVILFLAGIFGNVLGQKILAMDFAQFLK